MDSRTGETKPVIARYVNQPGAEIRITPAFGANQHQRFCTGCNDSSGAYYGPLPFTRQRANQHAGTCFALPPETPKDAT